MRSVTWTAGAIVFSGRPDPEWALPPERAVELMALWRSMAPSPGTPVPRTALGYRGCWIRDPDGERFVAFDGVVVHEARGGRPPEARTDYGRRFEQAVLATAPAGTLPPGSGP